MLRPVEFRLNDGETVAGVRTEAEAGDFTIVFIHEAGADLDAVLPVLTEVGIPEARKVAFDLPGHGLSSGKFDPARITEILGQVRERMTERGWAPFLLVAAGGMAPHALELAEADSTLGLCLVSPRINGEGLADIGARCPILTFVSSTDGPASADWLAIRAALRSWWMTVSFAADHAALMAGDGPASGQIASHLQGFARELYVTSSLLAGRIGPVGDPPVG